MNNKTTTLLLLRRGDEVLLAMKKRGFGAGLWNGVGGKLNPDETIEQALIRECREEIGVTPVRYHKIVEHDFALNSGQPDEWHMHCHTYFCSEWEGEPTESEEMAPRWFKIHAIPYNQMWPGDRYWMPPAFDGKLLRTQLLFDSEDRMLDHTITEVTEL